MKENERYKCPKCKCRKFYLVYQVFRDEFEGEYLGLLCSKCDSQYLSVEVDQTIFKHAERAYILEELGEPITKPEEV